MAKKSATPQAEPALFGRRNWQWLGAGVVTIIAGFIALSMGSITLAPLLLVAGYCVLIPVGILLGPKRPPESDATPSSQG
jgi:uncharacterized membrane protein HdeD (DUF308 family)